MKRILIIVLLAVLAYGVFAYVRPLPKLQPESQSVGAIKAKQVHLKWPNSNQTAIGAKGYGLLAIHGQQKSAPIASVAKIITVLSVLQKKPLSLGEQGPVITIDSQDVASYESYYRLGGSVAKVESGEKISEYQALQATLLPSANNMAETLARWAFGSTKAYINYANNMVKQMGLKNTHVSDASGFSPKTVSSAGDLEALGEAALDNPVIAQVVRQTKAMVPVAGKVQNTNWLLGHNGFIGIKTGNTDEAGGCFLFASKRVVEGHQIILVGAIMHANARDLAVAQSKNFVSSADKNFEIVKAISAGQEVGAYKLPWGGQTIVVAKKDVSLLRWKGTQLNRVVTLNQLALPLDKSSSVGKIDVSAGQQKQSASVVLSENVSNPSIVWRLLH